jgi:PAS domain S-box-containing protein
MCATSAEPSFDEAFSVLQQLAGVFLQGGMRASLLAGGRADSRARRMGSCVVDASGKVLDLDREAERLLGRSRSDVAGASASALFGPLPADETPVLGHVQRPDGRELDLWVTSFDVARGAAPTRLLTLEERDPASGTQTELRYRHLVEQIPAVIFTAELDGGCDIYVSPQIEYLLGYSQEQWISDPVLWYDRLHPDDRRTLDAEFARGCAAGGRFRADCRFLNRNDEVVWVHGEARLISDERGYPLILQGVAFDITEVKRAEEIVRASLNEKETLLREIHHRLKNNLQVTSSLLKLQADRIDDPAVKELLHDSQDRIRSMALVHDLLHRSKDLSQVDMSEYIRHLTRQLLRSHAIDPAQIRVESRLVPLQLSISLAVPCGLILNELVSNALRHAFPEGRRGIITIELAPHEAFDELSVRDDGVGMPSELTLRSGTTLGLTLVRTLAEQIGASLELTTNGRTEVRLCIPRRLEDRA